MSQNKRRRPGKQPVGQSDEDSPTVIWKREELETRDLFNGVIIHPTRFSDRRLLGEMGLLEGVDELLGNMGMGILRGLHYPTFPEAVKDFLSTVELNYENPKDKKASEGSLTFKIGKREYKLTIEQICEAYDFKNGETVDFEYFKQASALWSTIAQGAYRSNKAKMTGIRNPVIRYVCKLLANTFFARRDAGAVTMTEMCLIYQGLKEQLTHMRGDIFPYYYGDDINYGCIFADKLVSLKKWVRKTPKPDLYIGAMISPLLANAGVDLSQFQELPTSNSLSKDYLRESWFLKKARGFHYRIDIPDQGERILVLPHAETHTRTLENIRFVLPDNEFLPRPVGTELEAPEPEAPRGSSAMLQELDELEMPEIDFVPRTNRETLIQKAYRTQRRINELQKKLIKKLFRKLKKHQPPNYVSSEEEDNDE